MRQKAEKLLPLGHIFPDHQMSRELEKIAEILDENPRISELVLQDLCDHSQSGKGAGGLRAEFVLRAAIVKQLHGFSYEQLAFHLMDSQSFRSFVRHPVGWIPNKSTLQRNIAQISEASWKEINTVLVGWAAEKGLEKGRAHPHRFDGRGDGHSLPYGQRTPVRCRSHGEPASQAAPGATSQAQSRKPCLWTGGL